MTTPSVREFVTGSPRPLDAPVHDVGQGVGQGTVLRKRRNPRSKVNDVAIAEATGLTLGADGYPHPLETDGLGRLKIFDQETRDILAEVLLTQRAILIGLSRSLGTSVQELADEAGSSTELFGI